MAIQDNLEKLGIHLPEPATPIAAYVPTVQTGNLVFVSGQLPRVEGEILHPGKLGEGVNVEQGQAAARAAAINALAALRAAVGNLDHISRIVRVNGYVASSPTFTEHSKVIDGASSFFQDVFGSKGRHSRIAVGVASLPLNAPVEIDLIAEVMPE